MVLHAGTVSGSGELLEDWKVHFVCNIRLCARCVCMCVHARVYACTMACL